MRSRNGCVAWEKPQTLTSRYSYRQVTICRSVQYRDECEVIAGWMNETHESRSDDRSGDHRSDKQEQGASDRGRDELHVLIVCFKTSLKSI